MFKLNRGKSTNRSCPVDGCRGSEHCPLAKVIEERTELREIHIEMGATNPFNDSHRGEVARLIRNAPIGCVVYDETIRS